jgi:hypothetical protein
VRSIVTESGAIDKVALGITVGKNKEAIVGRAVVMVVDTVGSAEKSFGAFVGL